MRYWSLREYEPRPEQVKIIDEITESIDQGYKNIILEAGTGTGKSAIATTIARMVDESYILTMTNQLQKQYLHDFDYMLTEVKGRNNYACNYGGTCKDCQMEKENEKRCADCEYIMSVLSAQDSPCVISNYDYLFYAGNYAKQWDNRDLLILDEAHNFEKKVMSLVSEDLNRKIIFERLGFDIFESVSKGGALKNINNPKYWINILEKCIEKEQGIFTFDKLEEKKQQNYLDKYRRMIKDLQNNFIIELPLRKYIIADKDKSAGLKMTLKPLSGADYSDSLLKYGSTRLFMTGTLGNTEKFCEWNGLDYEDTKYIYCKSPFPVENRPIIKRYVTSMRQEAWRNHHIIKYIEKIMDSHQGEKGVIHTSSNQQAWWIKKQLNSNRVWVAQGKSREDTIRSFEESNYPITLVGAGLKDGVDFKGDKCRYQILFKVPYPNLGSQQVKIRRQLDESWYMYQTVMPLMQSYGRGIRDETDYCKFYVLDMDFEHLINEFGYLFNEYFTEAIQ